MCVWSSLCTELNFNQRKFKKLILYKSLRKPPQCLIRHAYPNQAKGSATKVPSLVFMILSPRIFLIQLHISAANGYHDVLDFLLSLEDIDIDAQDNEGWTPFMAAVCWNQKEAMEKLASKGADMDMKNLRGETAYGMFVVVCF